MPTHAPRALRPARPPDGTPIARYIICPLESLEGPDYSTLDACAAFLRTLSVESGRVYDRAENRRGKLFAHGKVRWNVAP